ncbi:acriflavine resistance protein B [Methylobacterium terricola]|uniref:Acriflavine resistance protein B n=1 Tax=Methylobacterium terricola TaxID=2583531 RepID=A0A5C4LB09_9HYPH|nr:efflux RND transporter permease subunit [Methylobacterium terricola]TNC10080.1 acriflavine resistance protein B [Methylobacterium terricola]
MNLAAPFVARPVGTALVALGLLLVGLVALARLPIASLPNVERPTIVVQASLPGASADTVATSLAQPLEDRLGLIAGLTEMSANSTAGGTQIFLQFALSKSIDVAAGDVQAAINAASPDLPQGLPKPPTYYKANPSNIAAVVLALTSDILPPSEVYELADSVVSAKLAALPGVAQVFVSGAERRAVRVRVSPRLMANMQLSLEQVRSAIRDASRNLPKGAVTLADQTWTLAADDQLVRAEDWAEVIVAFRGDRPIRLGDVAEVADSVADTRTAGWFNGERGVVIFVRKQPDANVVETVDAVKAALPEIARWLPPSLKVHTLYDRTVLIRESVDEVARTIAIAIGLVMVVVALFLRRLTATLVPVASIPVALALTVAAMALLGYSLDNLSLMALTIAVGFVVDDAVIVVEAVVRLMEEGRSATQAALEAARRMGATIVAISAALAAALVPVLLMPDVVGRYFREFGLTLVAAIAASALVSLTLVPMLCARLPRPGGGERPAAPSRAARAYRASLAWCLRRPWPVLVVLGLSAAGSAGLYAALPKGFMPTQDTGILQVRTITDANVSFTAMERLQRQVARAIQQEPAVAALSSYIGGGAVSVGQLYVGLKPLAERPGVEEVVNRLRERLAPIAGVRTVFTPQQDLSVGGSGGAARYQYTLVGPDPDALWTASEAMRRRMRTMPEITDIVSSAERSGLEAGLVIDRQRAAQFGVTQRAIDNTLYDAFGQRPVGMIYLPSNYAWVVLEVEPAAQGSPSALNGLYVPGASPDRPQVPLSEVMRPKRGHAAMWLRHLDGMPGVTLSFNTRPGVVIGDALAAIRAAEAALHFPDEIRTGFRGEAAEAGKSATRQLLLFLGAVAAIYVVLGVLYESLIHPLTILSTLPSAVVGGLLALRLTGTPLTLVASIACVLLVGIVMKNAILMVDVALVLQREQGMSPRDAILDAALSRARPILMTTLVAALSAVPLAFGTGPGHELRQPLGITAVGGLLVSQLLTLYSTPVVFAVLAGLARRREGAGLGRIAGRSAAVGR